MGDDLTFRLVVEILLLLLAANGAPIILTRLFGDRWAYPLDGGLVLRDGHRLFGKSKTMRGLVSGAAACDLTAWCLGYAWSMGVLFGLASLAGAQVTRRALVASLAKESAPEAPGTGASASPVFCGAIV